MEKEDMELRMIWEDLCKPSPWSLHNKIDQKLNSEVRIVLKRLELPEVNYELQKTNSSSGGAGIKYEHLENGNVSAVLESSTNFPVLSKLRYKSNTTGLISDDNNLLSPLPLPALKLKEAKGEISELLDHSSIKKPKEMMMKVTSTEKRSSRLLIPSFSSGLNEGANCCELSPSMKQEEFFCAMCCKVFISKKCLRRHMKIHMEKKKRRQFHCAICNKGYSVNWNLNIHMQTFHTYQRNFICEICNKPFITKLSLKLHLHTHYGGELYSCESCSKSFVQRSALIHHLERHFNENRYICEICNRKFNTYSSFYYHLNIHRNVKSVKCDYCDAEYSRKSDLRSHIEIHLKELYSCDDCGSVFTRKSYLRTHIKIHTQEKKYICSACGKQFSRAQYLRIHSRIHSGEKPFSCKICNQKFSVKSNLIVHLRSHFGDKPYLCHFCNKRFVASNDLNRHLRIHTGERYTCEHCKHACARKSSLVIHMKRHEDLKREVQENT